MDAPRQQRRIRGVRRGGGAVLTHSAAPETARRFLKLLLQPGDVFEIRAPECRDRRGNFPYTCSGYFTFDGLDRAVQEITELDRAGIAPGIYVTLNPVAPPLLARSANRIKTRAKVTTTDKDILCRRWLLIDVDPVRPTGVGASDTELASAYERARAIREHLSALSWPLPVFAMSGGGFHLLYRIDLPTADEGLVQAVLNTLADRFSDDVVAIDRSVHNPARITKVIGTMSRKGDDLRDVPGVEPRPHRRSELIEAPDTIIPVSREQLEAFADRTAHAPPPYSADEDDFDHTPAGVRAWLEARGVAVRDERRNGSKTMLLLERCPVNPEIVSSGGSDIAVLVGDDGKLAYCNKHNRGQAFTWHDMRRALDPDYAALYVETDDVDLSGLLPPDTATPGEKDPEPARPPDPGTFPEDMLRIPGFISEVMDYCLETAPYPNPVMAFCGALSLQAFLGARKVRDPGDNRTNLYLLGLAHSAAGKDWPRKVNTRILHEIGMAGCLGDRFASGEGIQDALFLNPAMLFQTDEIDGLLQSINKAKDARHENVMGTLLTMYSSSNSVFPMRRKAGKEAPGVIDQPCLVIFGTAIPNHYYEALSERMLTNGFFARMIVLEAGPRPSGQDASIRELPARVVTTARWWADFQPGERRSNLLDIYPVPVVVEHDPDAKRLLRDVREEADAEYANAETNGDPVGTTVWGRVNEQIRKMALLYAISESSSDPRIGTAAVEWASRFVMHQTRRMLFMASGHVAANEFDEECKRVVRALGDWRTTHPDHPMPVWRLRRALKLRPNEFRDVIFELEQRQEIQFARVMTKGRPKEGYVLQ